MPKIIIENNILVSCSGTEVEIPAGVTEIGVKAFYRCSSLRKVVIPEGVTAIHDQAFAYCDQLEEVIIPKSVVQIGSLAFSYCLSLKTLCFCGPTEQIGTSAFRFCESLQSVVLPDGLVRISAQTFDKCSSLCSVTIPNSVRSIGESAFADCRSLSSLRIPGSVISIEKNAFTSCFQLNSVTIDEGLQLLGDFAFSMCTSLRELHLPDSLSDIGTACFALCPLPADGNGFVIVKDILVDCINASSPLVLPDGIRVIDSFAFSAVVKLTDLVIPDGVTTVRDKVFVECDYLRSITIPDSIQSLDFPCIDEFSTNKSIITVHVNCLDTYLKCHFGTSHYLQIHGEPFNELTLPRGITEIPEGFFENNISLHRVVLPNTVTVIHKNAFHNCGMLRSIVIPSSVRTIESLDFGSSKVVSLYMDDLSVYMQTCIMSWHMLFLNNDLFNELHLPDGITSVGEHAFENCLSLRSITVPDSCTSISYTAFSDCSGLININMDPAHFQQLTETTKRNMITSAAIDSFFAVSPTQSDCTRKIIATYLKWKPVREYYLELFCIDANVGSLATLLALQTKPLPINRIDELMGQYSNAPELKAFWLSYKNNHYSQEAILLNEQHNMEKELGLRERSVTEWRKEYKFSIRNGEVQILKYLGNDDHIQIPAVIGKNRVTSIATAAFQYKKVKTVVFPEGIRSLGKKLFFGCHELQSLTFPDTVLSSEEELFGPIYTIPEVHVTSLETYFHLNLDQPHQLYLNGTIVETIRLPDGLEIIPDRAFANCTSLRSLYIPDGVTEIGEMAFDSCTNLAQIRFPNSLIWIGSLAFAFCFALQQIILPDSLKGIAAGAFYLDTEDTTASYLPRTFKIPASVELIQEYAIPSHSSQTILTPKGSCAEEFAHLSGITLTYI